MSSFPPLPVPPALTAIESIGVLLEEYRALYGLAQFRLAALDRRVPMAGGAVAAFVAAVAVLPFNLQLIVLLAVPVGLVWVLRTTATHACSFEDALRRIEEIEHAVNACAGRPLMLFQSRHPSRGRAVGGRTGAETVGSVFLACVLALGGCVWLTALAVRTDPAAVAVVGAYGTLSALALLWQLVRYRRYRYAQSRSPTG